MERCKALWASLEDMTTVSKKELFFEFCTCLLAGLVLGMLLSPRKHTSMGCNNGNESGNKTVSPWDETEE